MDKDYKLVLLYEIITIFEMSSSIIQARGAYETPRDITFDCFDTMIYHTEQVFVQWLLKRKAILWECICSEIVLLVITHSDV